jgi:hypothetical protein
MPTTAGASRSSSSAPNLLSLFTSSNACHSPYSYRCLSSIWNAVCCASRGSCAPHTPEALNPASVVCWAMLAVRGGQTRILTLIIFWYLPRLAWLRVSRSCRRPSEQPWSLDISPRVGVLRLRAKGRLEVRELRLKLLCHVPVGALKFF